MQLDLTYGVTTVLGEGFATLEGLGIGSPLAAGAATLAAAWLEERALRQENSLVKEELLRRTFIRR